MLKMRRLARNAADSIWLFSLRYKSVCFLGHTGRNSKPQSGTKNEAQYFPVHIDDSYALSTGREGANVQQRTIDQSDQSSLFP